MSHVYCPECGFQSPEAATFCSRCGALLGRETVDETTMSPTRRRSRRPAWRPTSTGRRSSSAPVAVGQGRASRRSVTSLIGRSPECDVFLDDVTVSRRHAELTRDGKVFTIRDLGSLNGTFVNKRRIESSVLEDDDEVQIGKYRMTFLRR